MAESDVYGCQILTLNVVPRAERVNRPIATAYCDPLVNQSDESCFY